jgi:hypothetical protein
MLITTLSTETSQAAPSLLKDQHRLHSRPSFVRPFHVTELDVVSSKHTRDYGIVLLDLFTIHLGSLQQ